MKGTLYLTPFLFYLFLGVLSSSLNIDPHANPPVHDLELCSLAGIHGRGLSIEAFNFSGIRPLKSHPERISQLAAGGSEWCVFVHNDFGLTVGVDIRSCFYTIHKTRSS